MFTHEHLEEKPFIFLHGLILQFGLAFSADISKSREDPPMQPNQSVPKDFDGGQKEKLQGKPWLGEINLLLFLFVIHLYVFFSSPCDFQIFIIFKRFCLRGELNGPKTPLPTQQVCISFAIFLK